YLRQSILCNLDITIEFAACSLETGKYENHIDGWGIPHQCIDMVSIHVYPEAVRRN
ncbi:MAG: hypothetical protein FE78DRAFT_149536, partial [Acidomyces sp. 'richmondensis']